MARYDATTKHLVESAPLDWVALAGFANVQTATVIDADVSTVTAQADKVILIQDDAPWMIHIEFQSSYEKGIGLRQCRYNVLLEYRHQHPVLSVLVLLNSDADGPGITGKLRRTLPDGTCYDEFQYHVIRVWELPVEKVLSGGLGTLPLAPLSGVPESQLPSIIERMKFRVDREISSKPDQREFWESTSILLGMRLPNIRVTSLIQGLVNMRESSVIQAFLEEGERSGELKGARKVLLGIGEDLFGLPDAATRQQIESLTDADQIAQLARHAHQAASWATLLAETNHPQSP